MGGDGLMMTHRYGRIGTAAPGGWIECTVGDCHMTLTCTHMRLLLPFVWDSRGVCVASLGPTQ